MSEPKKNCQESRKKIESGIVGKHYERKILALIALKCLLEEEINDFWIITNPKEVDKFDDVILAVEYNNKETELFMMQIKHKHNTERPIVADMLHQKRQEKIYLKNFENAYEDIIVKNKFFGSHLIQDYTKKQFILLNNCKCSTDTKNEYLRFIPVDQTEFRDFISTNTKNIAYKMEDNTEEYSKSFLKEFYFYPEQIHKDKINKEICDLLGFEDDNIINFIYHWADEKTVTKLKKSNLLSKLLEIWFDHYQPPKNLGFNDNPPCLEILKSFDITIISTDSSKNHIWSEMYQLMKIYSNVNISEESLEIYTFDEKLYIDMVAKYDLPFYIETNNRFFNPFISLLNKLKISTIVLNSKNEKLTFPKLLKVFGTMSDVEEKMFDNICQNVQINFHGINLLRLSKVDSVLGKAITVDVLLNLSKQTVEVNETEKSSEIHIQRTVKVPLISKQFLMEHTFSGYFFIICDSPFCSKIGSIETIPLYQYFKVNNVGLDYLLKSLEEKFGRKPSQRCQFESMEDCYILQTTYKYDERLLQMIRYSPICKNIFFILKYIPQKNGFLLLHTNGSINTVKPYILDKKYPIKDTNLMEFFKHSKINVICNNAGMGKTTLLKFLSQRFDSNELVTHVNLEHVEKGELSNITSFETLFNYFRECHKTNIDKKVFDALYNNRMRSKKLVWLVDDYGEFSDPLILELLKEASAKGVKIWIFVRPSVTIDFEMIFDSFAMELEHFSLEDQMNFSKQFFQMNTTSEEDMQKKLKIIEKLRNKLNDNFIGNCQQIMMLAEIVNNDTQNELGSLSLPKIYEKFISLKIENYPAMKKDVMLRTISKLALFQFFSKHALSKVFDWEEFDCDLQLFKRERSKDEFVIAFTNQDIPVFSHRTYAEFLAAQWMARTVKRQMKKETPFDITILVKMLFCQDLKNIRLFFDSLVNENIPLIPAIIDKNFEEITKIIANHQQYRDILGRTVFHILFSYGDNYYICLKKLTFKRGLHYLGEHAEIKRNKNKIVLSFPRTYESITNMYHLIHQTNIGEQYFFETDHFLKLNVVEYTLHAGALAELNEMLSITNEMPKLTKNTKYCLVYHAIKNKFTHILEALDLEDLDYKKVRLPPNTSLLHLAIGVNNEVAVRLLLKANPILYRWESDGEGNTPLHLACNSKAWYVIEHAINYNRLNKIPAEFWNMKNNRGITALHYAARKLSNFYFNQLILCGAEVNSRDAYDLTPLMYAAIAGRKDIIELIVSKNMKIDCFDKSNWTVLHHAIKSKQIEIIKILLKSKKLDIDHQTNRKMTPLMLACSYNSEPAVRLLIHYGANVSEFGLRALMIAYEKNNLACANLLLEYI